MSTNLPPEDVERIINTLNTFRNTDEQTIMESEDCYMSVATKLEDSINDNDYQAWYRDNINHIDSVSANAIELLEAREYDLLLTLLESELPKFKSHPKADTYTCFDLNFIIGTLSRLKGTDMKELCAKLVPLWELIESK